MKGERPARTRSLPGDLRLFDRRERIALLPVAVVTMIALAAFIVITHQAMPTLAVVKRVLEPMPRPENRLHQRPNFQFRDSAIIEGAPQGPVKLSPVRHVIAPRP